MLNCIQSVPNWVTWVFSGIGIFVLTGIVYLVRWLYNKKNINIQNTPAKGENAPVKTNKLSMDELKLRTNILFIDDESFKIVSILKKTEGWINTKSIKDIHSPSEPEIRWAHIIFVDVNGVGGNLFNNQGLGVAQEIKKRYPEKRVVLYSAETKHDAFSEAWDVVDARLPKNADPIVFITKVESFAKSIFNNE